jgi:hypothetical protein
MTGRRYTVVIADRTSGVMRQLTVNVRIAAGLVIGALALPILMGLGAKWSARNEIDQLRGERSMLQVENGSYRAATGELTAQIQSLETVINDLGVRSQLDPAQARAMQKLPAVVNSPALRAGIDQTRLCPLSEPTLHRDTEGGAHVRPGLAQQTIRWRLRARPAAS